MREHPNALSRYIFYGGPGVQDEQLTDLESEVVGVKVWGINVDIP
jgi:hypothetical protein